MEYVYGVVGLFVAATIILGSLELLFSRPDTHMSFAGHIVGVIIFMLGGYFIVFKLIPGIGLFIAGKL